MALEKTITISGKKVNFILDGSLPLRYRVQYQKDYFSDILAIVPVLELINRDKPTQESVFTNLDTTPIYNVVYLMAKTADGTIGEMIEWVASFDEFPVFDIFMELESLLLANMQTQVNKIKKK